jgi:hypothetical protein
MNSGFDANSLGVDARHRRRAAGCEIVPDAHHIAAMARPDYINDTESWLDCFGQCGVCF